MAKARSSPPLFVYDKGEDSFSFVAPSRVLLHQPGEAPCTTELPEGGNMYSGGDVVAAFNHPDVQTALEAHQRYAAASEGVLKANGYPGSITWTTTGGASPPIGVAQLHDVLDVVMLNRKLTCPP